MPLSLVNYKYPSIILLIVYIIAMHIHKFHASYIFIQIFLSILMFHSISLSFLFNLSLNRFNFNSWVPVVQRKFKTETKF